MIGSYRMYVEFKHLELCQKADEALLQNRDQSDLTKWKNCIDILALMKPLNKKVEDKSLPTRRDDILQRYRDYQCPSRIVVGSNILEKNQLCIEETLKSLNDNVVLFLGCS